MAAVPMSYRATLYDLANKRTLEVFLEGDATITGLSVGGGPLPGGPGGGGAHPEHPIFYPPQVWPTPPLRPSHPIVLPPDDGTPPTEPPTEPPTNPPNVAWSWCWSPSYGWHPAYVAGDKPQPPA